MNLKTDEETITLFEIARDFLVKYFSYELSKAEKQTELFYNMKLYDDDDYHEVMSYIVAAMIHFFTEIGGSKSEYKKWLIESGYHNAPEEAKAYFREKYFD